VKPIPHLLLSLGKRKKRRRNHEPFCCIPLANAPASAVLLQISRAEDLVRVWIVEEEEKERKVGGREEGENGEDDERPALRTD
jgi:hypothetical protein